MKNLGCWWHEKSLSCWIFRRKTISSSQTWAKAFAEHNSHMLDDRRWFVFQSDEQIQSYGQYARSFSAPCGGLYLTLLMRASTVHPLPLIAPIGTLSLIETLSHFNIGSCFKIKWVNDLYAGSKKTAGLLVEHLMIHRKTYWLVGVGLNVNAPIALFQKKAISLKDLSGRHFSLYALETMFLYCFFNHLKTLIRSPETAARKLSKHLAFLNEDAIFKTKDGWFKGHFKKIDAQGRAYFKGYPPLYVLSIGKHFENCYLK